MRHDNIAILAVALLAVSASAADRRPDAARLRIMSLNAEFLWDGEAPEEGQVSFPWKHAPDEAREHMREIADVIIAHDPDIVTLIEVENLDALQLLNTTFLAGRGYIAYLDKGIDTFTGQDVGILTRIDPVGDAVHYDDRRGRSGNTFKSVSKNCFATFDFPDRDVALIGIHLLARPLDGSRLHKRQAQADAVRSMAQELAGEGFELVVLGDFNDFDGVSGSRDHQDSMPITNVLEIVRALDPVDPNDDLGNVASLIAKSSRFTAHWDQNQNGAVDAPGELTSIDHILLSSWLFERVSEAIIPHAHDPLEVTDHFPVVVEIRLGDAPAPTTAAPFRIFSLLPNPVGDETENESVTIVNIDGQSHSLSGWTLRDRVGTTWTLGGQLAGGEAVTILRAGQQMALNNGGDTIDLLDPAGEVAHTITYGRVDEGEPVFTEFAQ